MTSAPLHPAAFRAGRPTALWISILAAVSFLTPCQADGSGPRLPGNLPATLADLQLVLVEVSWDFGDVVPDDWRKELTSSDPTAYFKLRWRYAGPAFDHAVLSVAAGNGTALGELPLPLGTPFGDGFRYTYVTIGNLPGSPPLKLRVRVKDAMNTPLGAPSNEVIISAESPPDPYLYTPLFILGVYTDNGVPGLAGSVWCREDGQVRTWYDGVRRFDGGAGLIASGDLWHIGSNTKAFTCTLLGVLIQNDTPLPGSGGARLNWDTPLSAIFPEWGGSMHSRFQSTTIRHLACHRSGLRMTGAEDAETRLVGPGTKNEDPTAFRREMTQRLLSRDHTEDVGGTVVSTTPGTKWFYGSGNFLVLGAVVEQLTGQTYETALRNMIFNPLYMTTARFGMPVDVSPYQPHGHYRTDEFPHNLRRDNLRLPPVWNPAGGLYCSQADWLRFCRLHITGQEALLTLRPATLAQLHTPHPRQFPAQAPDANDPNYGWGWGIMTEPGGLRLSHDGSYFRFYARHTVHTGYGFAVVSAVNCGGGRGFGDIAVGQLHNHLIEKTIAKVTSGNTTFGTVNAPSGGSSGTFNLPERNAGLIYDVHLDPPFTLGNGFLPASLALLDAYARSVAVAARTPRILSFSPDPVGRAFLLRFTSEPSLIYHLYRGFDLANFILDRSVEIAGQGSETQIRIVPTAGLNREFFQLRELMP